MAGQLSERVSKALGRIPSGCAVVTARAGNQRTGMLASWIQQAAFEPPMISVVVHKGRPIEKLIDESGTMVINMLGQGCEPVLRHFHKGFAPGEDAFVGLGNRDVPGGVAIDQGIARLTVRVHGKHDAGDHWLYLAVVTDAELGEGKDPYVHVRTNGLAY